MQVFRTAAWVIITAILVAFIAMNWERAPVNIWPLDVGYLHFLWPVGLIALVFFLLGLIPMWLVYKGTRWRLLRRISTLENSMRSAIAPPIATSTQLGAASGTEDTRPG
jgi:uncharacterized integral membrane protein